MKINRSLLIFALFLLIVSSVSAQEGTNPPPPKPTIKEPSTSNLEYLQQNTEIPRERREQAYAKLLEGQRYIWGLSNARSQAGIATGTKLAKESIQKAVELDPTLAEGYTALAELTYKSPPNDVDEAIRLATIAVKINPDNFGGHQWLARFYTVKSFINRGTIDKANTQKAIEQWKQVVRLDPRNAEGFAFLSDFYDKTNQPKEKIAALQSWLSSAQPIDSRFYTRIMGQQEDLSPESALVKLGAALIKQGEIREAVEILSRAVADNPGNEEAIELLSRAVESADDKTAAMAVEALQQAIFANPENVALVTLLAQIQTRAGNIDDAAKLLRNSVTKLTEKNKVAAANLQITLGDIYTEVDRYDEAVAVYKNTLPILGIENNELITDRERDYAAVIFEKMIQAYKNANRPNDAKKVIEQAGLLFGKDDLFADQKLIALYRENGQKAEALQTVRAARLQFPQDYELLRLEAEILTENGKVEEGVALLKALIGKKETGNPNGTNSLIPYDDFANYLYISNLYSQANRGKEAIEAANQALTIAKSEDRKQIAKLTMATAQQMSGNFQAAEQNLREILKQSPDNPIALNNLGYFLLERNEKINEALELIQKAVNTSPNNPSFLDSLGWAYFKLNKLDEAEKYLKSAARLDTSSATILEHLGDVYQKQAKAELAKETWRKALKISSEKEETVRLKTKLGEKIMK
jgi:tetratricopeptide (TPR) repeat protein